jgi:hypothetical protein
MILAWLWAKGGISTGSSRRLMGFAGHGRDMEWFVSVQYIFEDISESSDYRGSKYRYAACAAQSRAAILPDGRRFL